MDLLQLQYFQSVARLEHMTKAAEELRVAQPSLSKAISRLEKELGVPLFDRHGRHIRLNPYGKAFLARVRQAFAELSEGKREIQDMAGLQQGVVTLAVTIPRILPELLGAFLRRHPEVRFRQFIEPVPSMKRGLEEGNVDICISSIPLEGPGLTWEPLTTEEIHLLVPAGHPLAARDSISLAEAKDEPFIGMNSGFGFRDLTDRFCREAGFAPNIAFEGDEPDVISGLVRQGLGVAFVPAISERAKTAADPSTKRLRIVYPECRRTIGLAWSDSRYLSLAARRFREFVVAYFARIGAEIEKSN